MALYFLLGYATIWLMEQQKPAWYDNLWALIAAREAAAPPPSQASGGQPLYPPGSAPIQLDPTYLQKMQGGMKSVK